MVDDVKPDPKFELISSDGLFSELRRLRYGTGHEGLMPFMLTLTPRYVAREIQKVPPLSFLNIQRYAERNADKLKSIAKFEKGAWVQDAYPRIARAVPGSARGRVGSAWATPT
jgi:hypothetical protein